MNNRRPHTLDRDRCRANLLNCTRKAFRVLPPLANPRILDIGCGTGVSTLELVRISGSQVVALDIDQNALDKLVSRAKREGLSDRITVCHRSMQEMDFPPDSFDIIWTEGAISVIGFERGLAEWQDLLVRGGYLVVHDSMVDMQRKLGLAGKSGYTLLEQFVLPPDMWWDKYYLPLMKQIETLQRADIKDISVLADIKAAEREIGEFDRDNPRFGSVFLIMQKT